MQLKLQLMTKELSYQTASLLTVYWICYRLLKTSLLKLFGNPVTLLSTLFEGPKDNLQQSSDGYPIEQSISKPTKDLQ